MSKCEKCDQEGQLYTKVTRRGTSPKTFYLCDKHVMETGFCLWCGDYTKRLEDIRLIYNGTNKYCADCDYRIELMQKEQERLSKSCYED